MTIEAVWNNQVIAASDDTIVVEGNHYFPRGAVRADALIESEHTTFCPWKGTASYFTVMAGGESNLNAAWYYADPKEKALAIKGRIAFWKGIEVREAGV